MMRARARRRLAMMALAAGCGDDGDTPVCTGEVCRSEIEAPLFVDDAGTPVTTRGELRATYPNGLYDVTDFDCVPNGSIVPGPGCRNGSSEPLRVGVDTQSVVEVRFARRDGGWTDWRALALTLTEHTDPNFAGPGCSCSWYEAPAPTLVVPPEARWETTPP